MKSLKMTWCLVVVMAFGLVAFGCGKSAAELRIDKLTEDVRQFQNEAFVATERANAFLEDYKAAVEQTERDMAVYLANYSPRDLAKAKLSLQKAEEARSKYKEAEMALIELEKRGLAIQNELKMEIEKAR